jgi:hypothetical protein
MDSNFKVKVSADLTELQKSLGSVKTLLGNVGSDAQVSSNQISESTKRASASVGDLAQTFKTANAEANRGRLVTFAFGQVIRDAGFFSQSFGLGLLAISNNIPILIDQLALAANVSKGMTAAFSLMGSLLTAALTVVAYSMGSAKKATDSYAESMKSAVESSHSQIASIESLVSVARNEELSYNARKEAIDKLNKEYPQLNNSINLQNINSKEAEVAINSLTNAIIQQAKVQAYAKLIGEEFGKQFADSAKPVRDHATLMDKASASVGFALGIYDKFGNVFNTIKTALGGDGVAKDLKNFNSNLQTAGLKNYNESITDSNTRIKAWQKELDKLNISLATSGHLYTDNADKGKKLSDVYAKLNAELSSINLDPTLSEIDKAKEKINAYQSALKALIEIGLKPNSEAVKSIVSELTKLGNTYDTLISKQEDLKKQTTFLNDIDKVAKSLENRRIDIYSGSDLSKSKQIKQEIEATADALSKFQALAKENPALAQFSGLNTVIGILGASLTGLKDKFNIATETENAAKQLEDFNKRLVDILESGAVNAISSTMQGIGEAIASGGNIATAAGSALLGSLGAILTQLGEMAIATGIAISGIKKALSSLNPAVAIAAGVVLLALAGFVKGKAKSIGGGMGENSDGGQKNQSGFGGLHTFASGGIISGPTNALMGEYPGAKSNPEVVAPLDKLQGIIAGSIGSGGGNMTGSLQTRISGNDLVILMERANKNRNGYF